MALLAHLDPKGLSSPTISGTKRTQLVFKIISNTLLQQLLAGLGEAAGATFAGNITAVILGGAEGVYNQTVTGVAKGYDYVDWSQGDPLDEHSNFSEVVKVLVYLRE